jgi:hypothetical protein
MMQDLVVIEGYKSSKRLCSLVEELLCHAKFDLLDRSLKEGFNIKNMRYDKCGFNTMLCSNFEKRR